MLKSRHCWSRTARAELDTAWVNAVLDERLKGLKIDCICSRAFLGARFRQSGSCHFGLGREGAVALASST